MPWKRTFGFMTRFAGILIATLLCAARSQDHFVFAVCGDHFEDPPAGMVEGIVSAKPAFVVSTGDLVFRSNPRDFARLKRVFLDPLAKAGAEFYPCLGNHDFPIDRWPTLWGPEKGRNYYSFDRGNGHFVVLDCNRAQAPDGRKYKDGSEESFIRKQSKEFHRGSEQYAWLIKDLEKTRKKHLFAFIHHAVFSFGGHSGEPSIQEELGPVFEKYRFTAVFSGHSHGYERFKPIRIDVRAGTPQASIDEKKGVTYIVTASGSSRKNLYDIKANPLHAVFKKAPNYVVLRVDGAVVGGKTYEPGVEKPIDTFMLKSRR